METKNEKKLTGLRKSINTEMKKKTNAVSIFMRLTKKFLFSGSSALVAVSPSLSPSNSFFYIFFVRLFF